MKKITLFNKFHNTSMNIMADEEMTDDCSGILFVLDMRAECGDFAAKGRASRIRRNLCGHDGCTCNTIDYTEEV